MSQQSYQTIVIGAGPAGASAAIYLARFSHEVLIIDAGEKVPGRTSMATTLRNFLGHTLMTPGSEFLSRVKVQLDEYKIPIESAVVEKVSQDNGKYVVKTDNGNEFFATYLVLAVGVGDNMPEIDGLDPYYDTSIFHCMTCDWYERRDRKIAVVANDDRGITTALVFNSMQRPPSLAVIPAKKPEFSESMLAKAKAAQIPVYISPLKAVNGTLGNLNSVTLEDGTEVEAQALFTKLGHVRFDNFLDKGGIAVDREPEEGFIKVNWKTFESSAKNLFAVGPCNDGPDQAIIAGGEGAIAALEIHHRILSDKGL